MMLPNRTSTSCAARDGPHVRRRAAALAALVMIVPGIACAIAPPDSLTRLRLQSSCDSARQVRIVTRTATRVLHRVELRADGIRVDHPGGRPALVVLNDPGPSEPERILPWSEVESLSLARPRAARGLLVGALIGGAVGAGAVATLGPNLSEPDDHFVVVVAAAAGLGMAGLGALIGFVHPEWRPLYP